MAVITRKEAEDIRDAITARFSAYSDSKPVVTSGDHENLHAIISWEEGPYEWALYAFDEYFDEEIASLAADFGAEVKPSPAIKQPHADKILVEPINSFTVGLYLL